MERRKFLKTIAAGSALAGIGNANAAPAYPVRPVTLVVAFSTGGGTDTLARAIAVPLGEKLGQTVIVENKPGAGAVIGSDYVAKSRPDGYTLLVTSAPHVSNPSLVEKMPFDTVKAFAPVCLAAQSPFVVVVRADSPVRSIDDLVAQAKKRSLS